MQHKKMSTLVIAGALLAGGLMASPANAAPTAEALAGPCAACHGTDGVSAGPSTPTLAGLNKNFLMDMMKAFKSGDRPSTIMDRISQGYSDEDIEKIASYFAGMKFATLPKQSQNLESTMVDSALVKKGKEDSKKCEKCHEDDGVSQEDDIPRVAGQWVDYLLIQMADYKSGHLPMTKKMKKQVEKKSMDELNAIAHFWASQSK